jgi:GT2 family glycosyltransferase
MAADGAGVTSVVIVAADSGPLLADSVASALASVARVEVIVVDNASADGEPERVASLHRDDARFQLVKNDRNLGFGPACNRGAALANGDALLFLNPDCVIERETIATLRAIAGADASIGVLGVEVLSPDGKPARGNRRRDPLLRRALMSMSGLARFESRSRAFEGVEMPAESASASGVEKLEAVSGACLFLPRRVFDAVGGFDEAYFLHVEDLDLCRRVRDAGYAVALARGIHVMHVQGTSSRKRPLFVARHKHRGMWRWFTRFDPAARMLPLRALVALGLWAHFALIAPLLFARQLAANLGRAKKETPRAT